MIQKDATGSSVWPRNPRWLGKRIDRKSTFSCRKDAKSKSSRTRPSKPPFWNLILASILQGWYRVSRKSRYKKNISVNNDAILSRRQTFENQTAKKQQISIWPQRENWISLLSSSNSALLHCGLHVSRKTGKPRIVFLSYNYCYSRSAWTQRTRDTKTISWWFSASLLSVQQELECSQLLRILSFLFEKSREDDQQSRIVVTIRKAKRRLFLPQKRMEVILRRFCKLN